MLKSTILASPVAVIMSIASAQAATTIIDLNASSTNPNAGNSSGSTYTYNPKTVSLAAGSYQVQVVGINGGGLYDAYSVYSPTSSNGAFTDGNWSVSLNNGSSAAYTQASLGRFNTAAAALAAYSPASYTFTLNSAQTVSFYVDDTAYPYFGDDGGGVSLAVSQVPEPSTIGLLGAAIVGLGITLRRRRAVA